MSPSFVAMDFETADSGADSACAIGLVKVRSGQIVEKKHFLIRPPRRKIVFTYIHGISWSNVADAPSFSELWPSIEAFLGDEKIIAAHNASFDRRVLESCCIASGITPPRPRYLCTVELAREVWNIFPTRLPLVCQHLGISLRHHEALSDAEACAQIVIRAARARAMIS